MAPLRFAALSFGTLALMQGNSVCASITIETVTNDVITSFNLMRNGKIDFELQSLIPIPSFDANDVHEGIIASATCDSKDGNTWKKALVLKLEPAVDNKKYGPNLDTLIKDTLQRLLDAEGKAADTTANLAHIVNPKAAQVGCGLASDCSARDGFKRLFCQFKTSDGNLIEAIEAETIPMDFLNAMKARKDANVTISSMTADDLNTRLTSGVSKVTVSALAALAMAVPALLF